MEVDMSLKPEMYKGSVKKEFNNNLHFVKSNEKIFNFNYISLDEGDDDILIVRNYIPKIIYTVKKGDNIIDIMSRGYEVGQIDIEIQYPIFLPIYINLPLYARFQNTLQFCFCSL